MAFERFGGSSVTAPPKSAASNYYDFLAKQAQINALGRSSSNNEDKKYNSQQVNAMIDTFSLYTELYTNQWKNRQITGAQFDQKMSDLLNGVDDESGHHPGILENINWWTDPAKQEDLTEGTINKLQAQKNLLIEATSKNSSNISSPFYNLDDKIAHPDMYADFQNPNDASSFYRAQKPGNTGQYANINGIYYPLKTTVPLTADVPNEVKQRYIIQVQDMDNPKETKDIYYTPESGRVPIVQIDPNKTDHGDGLSPGVRGWDSSLYKPIVKTPAIIHDTQSGSYYKIDPTTMQKSLIGAQDGFTPVDLLRSREVDSSILKNFQDFKDPALEAQRTSNVVPVQSSQGDMQSHESQPSMSINQQPRILDVSPDFIGPRQSKIGAPKSRGVGGGFGGGGGGSF